MKRWLVVFDGGGTIWNSMPVLYDHYRIAALYFGLVRAVEDFPYSLRLMNELSSLRAFNSRKNIAKALTALLLKRIKAEELDQLLGMSDAEQKLLDTIASLIPDQKFWEIATLMGAFLEEALYNYPEEWYPKCEGLDETLRQLKEKGHIITILSNRRRTSVMNILKAYKIVDFFHHVEAPKTGEPLKKDVLPLLRALRQKGLEVPSQMAFIGDSLLDILSAHEMRQSLKNAREEGFAIETVKVVGVLSGMGTERMFRTLPTEKRPDVILSRLTELPVFLERSH